MREVPFRYGDREDAPSARMVQVPGSAPGAALEAIVEVVTGGETVAFTRSEVMVAGKPTTRIEATRQGEPAGGMVFYTGRTASELDACVPGTSESSRSIGSSGSRTAICVMRAACERAACEARMTLREAPENPGLSSLPCYDSSSARRLMSARDRSGRGAAW